MTHHDFHGVGWDDTPVQGVYQIFGRGLFNILKSCYFLIQVLNIFLPLIVPFLMLPTLRISELEGVGDVQDKYIQVLMASEPWLAHECAQRNSRSDNLTYNHQVALWPSTALLSFKNCWEMQIKSWVERAAGSVLPDDVREWIVLSYILTILYNRVWISINIPFF